MPVKRLRRWTAGGRLLHDFTADSAYPTRARTRCTHRHQEFLAFLKHIDQAVPADLDVHLIVDHYATHKHPKIKAWLAKHTRYHMHFTSTYSSWLNHGVPNALLLELDVKFDPYVPPG